MSPVRSKTAPRSAETRTETADVSLKRKALSLALFLIVAASMLNALFGDRGLLELLRARQEIESLDREIATLRTQNQGLLGEIRDLKTSPLAVERLARENLALVKPGEIVLLIRETEVDTELADSIGRAGQANQANQERSETAP
jgi:cell division protein FtsB